MNAPLPPLQRGASATAPGPHAPHFDVIVVGGGFAGMYALHRLRGMGLRVRVYEAGGGLGGTWYWNRYPGARCDVESLEYSYSFSEDLQQQWRWPERYGTQSQILEYVDHVAQRFDLLRDIQLNTRVVSAVRDEGRNRWIVGSVRGADAHARHDAAEAMGGVGESAIEYATATWCVMAAGNLSTPRVPAFKGIERFRGKWYHTGLWPHEGVDFTGLRVGIIGTGSSAVQAIPIIARQARHLHVFQRTANYSVPARNGPMDGRREQNHKAGYAERRRSAYDTPFGIAGYPPPTHSALAVSDAERDRTYEAKWQEGGSISFLYSYTDLLTNAQANETASEFVRRKIRATVRDPKVAELLCPKDHPIGTKRLCVDTDYYETYNRDNVTLVDARSAPIQEITETGLRTGAAEYEFDALIFATGFDAMTGALAEIDVRNGNGLTLQEKWSAGPVTYLGLTVAGFPNMFVITGPGSPGVKSNMILSIEQHVNWIADCLRHLGERGLNRMVADERAELAWVEHVRGIADATLYPLANSWYMGANIPGKPRVFMPYVGGVQAYRRQCDAVAANGYEGFVLDHVEEKADMT